MTEYITKERAQDLIVTAAQGNGSRLACMLSKLEDEPPADVAPVVHAQWEIPIFIDGNDVLDPRVKCSECGEVEAALARWKYCPNCGARMDGGDEE